MVNLLRTGPFICSGSPTASTGEEIYQKRVPQKRPDYLETCTVTFPRGAPPTH